MGGSVARALKRLDPAPMITAFTRDASDAELAVRESVLDEVAETPADAVRDQDFVVYVAPLRVTVDLMAAHSGLWGEAAVTDVVGGIGGLLPKKKKK